MKEKRLNELGKSVLRFDDSEVFEDIENVLRTIENWIKANGHTPACGRQALTLSKGENSL